MKLVLKNNVDKKEYVFTGLTDNNTSGMFYQFNIQLEDGMPDGEYNYVLFDNNNKQVAEGISQIGDYTVTPEEQPIYNNNNTEYIQYNG